jgi:hypothetical protein
MIYAVALGIIALVVPFALRETLSAWVVAPVSLALGLTGAILLAGREKRGAPPIDLRVKQLTLVLLDLGLLGIVAGAILRLLALLLMGLVAVVLGALLHRRAARGR